MPELKWDPQDVLECLGVVPVVEEHALHSYTLHKEGLVLNLGVWQHDCLVELSISKEDVAKKFLSLTFLIRGEIRHMNTPNFSGLKFKDVVMVPTNAWVHEGIHQLAEKEIFPFEFDIDLWVYPDLDIKVGETI